MAFFDVFLYYELVNGNNVSTNYSRSKFPVFQFLSNVVSWSLPTFVVRVDTEIAITSSFFL